MALPLDPHLLDGDLGAARRCPSERADPRQPLIRWALAFLLCGLPQLALAQWPLGDEFPVSTVTTTSQFIPSVGTNPAGGFFASWVILGCGSCADIRGRAYDSDGMPLGIDFEVSTPTSTPTGEYHWGPRVSAGAGDGYVTVWGWLLQDGGGSRGIRARSYSSSGVAAGSQFEVDSPDGGGHSPAVAAAPDGSFVVVWTVEAGGLAGRLFGPGGTPRTAVFPVSGSTLTEQGAAAIALAADGSFLVVWQYQDADGYQIKGRSFGSDGSPGGAEFSVSTDTASLSERPSVACDAAGRGMAVWLASPSGGSGQEIRARLIQVDGTPLGDVFQVAGDASTSPASVTAASGHGFFVAWQAVGGIVEGRRYSREGIPSAPFQVSTGGLGAGFPSASMNSSGDLVVAWGALIPGSSSFGILARRYAPGALELFVAAGDARGLSGGKPPSTRPVPDEPPRRDPSTKGY